MLPIPAASSNRSRSAWVGASRRKVGRDQRLQVANLAKQGLNAIVVVIGLDRNATNFVLQQGSEVADLVHGIELSGQPVGETLTIPKGRLVRGIGDRLPRHGDLRAPIHGASSNIKTTCQDLAQPVEHVRPLPFEPGTARSNQIAHGIDCGACRLHAFEDGTGCLARAITDLPLCRDDGQPIRQFSLSAQILSQRDDDIERPAPRWGMRGTVQRRWRSARSARRRIPNLADDIHQLLVGLRGMQREPIVEKAGQLADVTGLQHPVPNLLTQPGDELLVLGQPRVVDVDHDALLTVEVEVGGEAQLLKQAGDALRRFVLGDGLVEGVDGVDEDVVLEADAGGRSRTCGPSGYPWRTSVVGGISGGGAGEA